MKIKSVFGPEPMRADEYATSFQVGYGKPTVHRIEVEEQNLGTYGIMWFVAYDENGEQIGRMNALHTSEVYYYPEKTDAVA